MFKTNRATSHSQWVRTRQPEFRPLGPALIAWCGHHGRPGPHCWECAEGGSLGLTGHQPCWKTASSGFTERVFQENKADPQKKIPEFSPGLNTHVHTHADTIHVPHYTHKRTQSQVYKKVSTGVSAPLPQVLCATIIVLCLCSLRGPHWVFLQPLLPALLFHTQPRALFQPQLSHL